MSYCDVCSIHLKLFDFVIFHSARFLNFWGCGVPLSNGYLLSLSQLTKFLYGCAVNALILKVDWLTDSVAAGSIIPPEK
jgi:hypothetical protein